MDVKQPWPHVKCWLAAFMQLALSCIDITAGCCARRSPSRGTSVANMHRNPKVGFL